MNYVQYLAQQVVNLLALEATSAKLQSLVARWFYGANRPIANTMYMPMNVPLFTAAGPQYTDCIQGGLADCYIISSLAQVAIKAPDVIRNAFIDNGDGTYTFRYYVDPQPYFQLGTPVYLTVDNQLPTGYASWNNCGWVGLAEKAMAQLQGSYANLAFGSTIGAMTGWTGDEWEFPVNTLSDFEAAYNRGDFIVFETSIPTSPSIVGQHSYCLIGYNSSNQILTVYNPWGIVINVTWNVAINNFNFELIRNPNGTQPLPFVTPNIPVITS